MEYKTRQRRILTSLFEQNTDKALSANDAAQTLSGKIGKSTVYREISRLCEEGILRKFADSDGSTMYQLAGSGCNTHFHLRCSQCGRVVHLDCHLMDNIINHIKEDHSFDIDISKTVLHGICKDCKEQSFM